MTQSFSTARQHGRVQRREEEALADFVWDREVCHARVIQVADAAAAIRFASCCRIHVIEHKPECNACRDSGTGNVGSLKRDVLIDLFGQFEDIGCKVALSLFCCHSALCLIVVNVSLLTSVSRNDFVANLFLPPLVEQCSFVHTTAITHFAIVHFVASSAPSFVSTDQDRSCVVPIGLRAAAAELDKQGMHPSWNFLLLLCCKAKM